jgi:hypothetical protein
MSFGETESSMSLPSREDLAAGRCRRGVTKRGLPGLLHRDLLGPRAHERAARASRVSTPERRCTGGPECPIYLSPAATRTKSIRLHQVWQPKAGRGAPIEDDEEDEQPSRQAAR